MKEVGGKKKVAKIIGADGIIVLNKKKKKLGTFR